MEEQSDILEIKAKNMYAPLCITQAICIAVILIVVLIIKFFFASSFETVKNWCQENVLQETIVTANFDEETNSEI